jgi:hypothetical protein
MHDALDALVAGEHCADDEQHHGNQERVKVTLSPETEWVLLCLGALRPGSTEQQQDLIAGVGDRVDALRQERRRAGDRESDELGDRYAQVCTQGGNYCPLAPTPAVPFAATTGAAVAAAPGSRRLARCD